MNIQQAKISLDKINALYKTMTLDERHISNIERDLMLTYIRQLYDAVLSENKEEPKQAVVTPAPVETPRQERPAVKIIEKPAAVHEPVELKKPKEAEKGPVVVFDLPVQEPVVHKPVVETPKPEPVVEVKPPVVVETPKHEEPPVVVPATVHISDELVQLFEFGQVTDLSQKLSETPIADIKKAIGLNDRLLLTNELFGGQAPLFEETVQALNNMSHFEEAKKYLVSTVANRYNWGSDGKKKVARDFVKLVRRRYK